MSVHVAAPLLGVLPPLRLHTVLVPPRRTVSPAAPPVAAPSTELSSETGAAPPTTAPGLANAVPWYGGSCSATQGHLHWDHQQDHLKVCPQVSEDKWLHKLFTRFYLTLPVPVSYYIFTFPLAGKDIYMLWHMAHFHYTVPAQLDSVLLYSTWFGCVSITIEYFIVPPQRRRGRHTTASRNCHDVNLYATQTRADKQRRTSRRCCICCSVCGFLSHTKQEKKPRKGFGLQGRTLWKSTGEFGNSFSSVTPKMRCYELLRGDLLAS